ncbi:MAG: CocE/NonD family hydrolase [Acidobacteria bacterium]|nr:MAG: CocE/NonD family hydrolase [Acidobacteriota bacterium]
MLIVTRILRLALLVVAVIPAAGQQRTGLTPEQIARRWDLEKQLQEIAVVERKLMVPMRDGVRMAADVYRPKNVAKAPVIFVRTPYNFNFWDVRNGVPRDMSQELNAVKRGYAFVEMNERGHFFSEGNYDILGAPVTDGYDAIKWMASQPWSNGKVGLIGCSSTAEWQSAVAATAPPGLVTMILQGFGAGVGRVGPYYEQGNWYRGGAVQLLFVSWLYGEQNQVRPTFPPNTSQEDLIRASRLFDLAPQMSRVDWAKAFWHLPVMDIVEAVGGPHGVFADPMPVPTGGAMIKRTPNDPAWYRGGLWHDNMKINVPGLYFMSWYDVSVGPNLAQYNQVRKTADPEIGKQQYAVIAPTLHCAYRRASENTIVGQRSVGDARWDYDALTYGWFDYFLKGENNGVPESLPRVRYYTMGSNKWQSSDTWPPAGAEPLTFYLTSGGHANTLNGDGVLSTQPPSQDLPDRFTYDPMNPAPSRGGNVCCQGNAVSGGAFDQRTTEEREDVLVYSTEPLKEGMEVSGPVNFTVYVSSDRIDTDITVKLIDVYPDGAAYNLDETIQRLRYREGYDKPETRLEPGKVYKVSVQPMTTSNFFDVGHRIRIEVSSSNFPRFDRNLNTGGRNYDENTGLVAHNEVHHSEEYQSTLTLTVVKQQDRSPFTVHRSHLNGER